MQQIFPRAGLAADMDIYSGLRLQLPHQPQGLHLAMMMVSTVDGAASLAGTSSALGAEADGLALRALRAAGDAVLVGMRTAQAEQYGPITLDEQRQAERKRSGFSQIPRLVVVTRSGTGLDRLPGCDASGQPPIVIAGPQAAIPRALQGSERAQVIKLNKPIDDTIQPALSILKQLGLIRVVCEGGPSLNAALLREDAVREVFVTLSPLLVTGDSPRITAGKVEGSRTLTLRSVFEHEDELLLRYRVD